MRSSLLAALALSVVFASSCSSSRVATAPPITTTVGDLAVRVAPDTATFTMMAPDGTLLLEGIDASHDVGAPQSDNDDAPPMTGFAVRDVATTYAMSYGSFRVADDTSRPWRVATRARTTGPGAPIDLVGDDGVRLATITLTAGLDARHLVIAIDPGDDAPRTESDPNGPRRRVSWGFRCDARDHFAGFGAQTWGVDARKETIPLWTSEEGIGKNLTTDDTGGDWFVVGRRHSSQMPVPEMLASRGYALVAETVHRSTFALCSERDDVARMELELPVKVHVMYGPTPHESLTRATAQFGRPRVPPAFAFAPWNDAIFGSDNVRRVATKLRAVGAPSSVIWTEDWRGGEWSGDRYTLKEEWGVDRTLYPDFEAVANDLHAAGFKWLVYFNPFVEAKSQAWPETAPGGLLLRKSDGTPYTFADAKFNDASMVDLSDPKGTAWAVGKMKDAIALGADGWMGDYGEWLPTDTVMTGGSGLDLHALYPVMWQKAQRQAMDEATQADGVERLSLVRSGWLGTAPLADVFWAGDQRTDFEPDDGLPTILPIGIGVGLAGVSTFGHDIAGYQSQSNAPANKELFFRWTELGAWSPVMRTHHGTVPKLEWGWESDDETTAHWVRYAKLHVSLAPWLRGLAQGAHDTGVPIWRALAVEFPDDGAAWPVADEVLVGGGALVAPVQVAGATSRSVYLPHDRWYPWDGGPPVDGPATITATAAVGDIPVYARAGAIVPTYPDGVATLVREASSAAGAASAKDDRIVYAFAGASGRFTEAPDASSAGPLAYTLESAPGGAPDAAPEWNGKILSVCDGSHTAPCAELGVDRMTAYVVGTGELVVVRAEGAAKVTIDGGAADRKLVIVVRT